MLAFKKNQKNKKARFTMLEFILAKIIEKIYEKLIFLGLVIIFSKPNNYFFVLFIQLDLDNVDVSTNDVNEKWVWAKFKYFNLNLDFLYSKREVVIVRRKIYY